MPIAVPPHLAPHGGHPDYHTNESKATHKGIPVDQTGCCALCGKKALGGKTFVALTDMTEYTTKEELHDCDLGLYPIGSDCMKKLSKVGVTIYDWEFNVVLAPKVAPVMKERK